VFFTLMIAGLASSLQKSLSSGLQHQGVPAAIAHQIGSLPPVSSLFAAVLGVNPVQHLLATGGVLASLPAASRQVLTGREFFPSLISVAFHHGLMVVFAASAVLAALAGLASLLRGARPTAAAAPPAAPAAPPAKPAEPSAPRPEPSARRPEPSAPRPEPSAPRPEPSTSGLKNRRAG
jgi:hypothetical protein